MPDVIKIIHSTADTIAIIHSVAQQIKKLADAFDAFKKDHPPQAHVGKGPMLGASHSIANKGNEQWYNLIVASSHDNAENRLASITAIIETMLASGVDLNAKGDLGKTLLHKLAEIGDSEALIALIAAGADVNATDSLKETPLHIAVSDAHPDVVSALIAGGANVKAQDENENTPLHMLRQSRYESLDKEIQDKRVQIVTTLVAAGAEINTNGFNGTPLHMAALHHAGEKAIAALLAAGADINAVDAKQNTPLHYAATIDPVEAEVAALIKAGASPDARNADGKTPEAQAKKGGELSGLIFRNAVQENSPRQPTSIPGRS